MPTRWVALSPLARSERKNRFSPHVPACGLPRPHFILPTPTHRTPLDIGTTQLSLTFAILQMSSRCLRESISVIPISTRICEIQCSRDHRLRKSLASKELRKGAEDKLSLTFALLQLSPRCLPQSVSANP